MPRPIPIPDPPTGPIPEGHARITILVDTAIGSERVRATQVVDAPTRDAIILIGMEKARVFTPAPPPAPKPAKARKNVQPPKSY